jgi:hypothetical protein
VSKRHVLTIATGKKLYLDFAVNLARSFWLWNANSGIDFYIATDQTQHLPEDVKAYIQIIPLKPGELGEGFSPKLYLDRLAPEGQTLFIDSDCLVYGNLDFVFKKFEGHAVSVIGNYISTGEWFGDIGDICKQFNVAHLPKFNGGIYYLENGKIAGKVYQTARSLEDQYDEIGFVRFRNRPADEVVMALAMELNKQVPITDDGSIMAEFVNFQSGVKSDLLKGIAELYNDPANPCYQVNWHLKIARPTVVHFLGHYNQFMPYIKEVQQLKYLFVHKWSKKTAKLITFLQITVPFKTLLYIKNTLRPIYRTIFGMRKIKKSERIID